MLADQGARGTLGANMSALKRGNAAYECRLCCFIWCSFLAKGRGGVEPSQSIAWCTVVVLCSAAPYRLSTPDHAPDFSLVNTRSLRMPRCARYLNY